MTMFIIVISSLLRRRTICYVIFRVWILLLKLSCSKATVAATAAVKYGSLAMRKWINIVLHGGKPCKGLGTYHMITEVII